MTNVNVLLLVVVAAVVVVVVIVVVMIVVVVVVVLVVILIVVLLYQGVHAGDAEGPGRGDDTVGDPHRAQGVRTPQLLLEKIIETHRAQISSSNLSIRVVRTYPLLESRRKVP